MILTVNNQRIETDAKTLDELSVEMSLPDVGIAIAVENKLVVRAEWEKYALSDGMKIVIIKAACGG